LADTTIHSESLVHVTPGFDEEIRTALLEAARQVSKLPVLDQGVYFQTRGPRLETRAEIQMIREVADCVGMTVASEATIAREMGLQYAALCTLDNYANGVRDQVIDYPKIQQAAARNAQACLEIAARAVEKLR
jgi:5'-methylthioadenosine phosphorylase